MTTACGGPWRVHLVCSRGHAGIIESERFIDCWARYGRAWTRETMKTSHKSYLVAVVSLAVGLGLAELLLRVTGFRGNASFYELDFVTGWKLRAGASGWQTAEGDAFVEINALGMRDKARTVEKPAGRLRIAVMGDSFVEAMQLPLEKTFPALMERQVAECVGKPVEALNFGVTGYGTAQELLAYRHRAAAFAPEVVVLVVFAGNDLYNNVRALNPTNADAAPYFRLGGDGGLEFVEAFAEEGKPGPATVWMRARFRELHGSSRLVQLGTEAYYNYQRRKGRAADQTRIAQAYGKDYMEWLAYVPPRDEAMRESWIVTQKLLVQFRDEVQRDGRKFVLVLADNAVQVLPEEEDRRRFAGRYGIERLDYADLRLKKFAEANGIRVVWLAEGLRAVAEREKVYLHGFGMGKGSGHWNEAGHRAVAERIGEEVCAALR